MADDSTVMSQSEIGALKETLSAQQELLQKLHNELDAEREAAATAASEALSVILRLQGEKAAVKMEAEQYKRLAEERMCHAEESFAVVEDIIQEREMEVAALDYQVQTYRCKLLSMGCDDPCDDDLEFPESPLVQRIGTPRDTGSLSLQRRNSEPVLVKYTKPMIDRQSSLADKDMITNVNVEEPTGHETDLALDSEKKADNPSHERIDSYGENVRKLSVRVKQIAGDNCSNNKNGTRSPPSVPQSDLNVSNEVVVVDEVEEMVCPENSSKEGEPIDSHCATSVLDVFEVPQANENCWCGQSSTDGERKKDCLTSKISDNKEQVHPEAVKLFTKGENDWLKKLLESTHDEKHLCKPSQVAAIERGVIVEPETSVTELATIEPPVVKSTKTSTEPAASELAVVKPTKTSTEPAAIELAVVKPARSTTKPAVIECAVVEPGTTVTEPTAIEYAVVEPATRVTEPSAIECAVVEPAKSSAAIECPLVETSTNGASIQHAVQPATSVTEPESSLSQINRTSVTNEVDRLADFTNREAELKLLKEINAKLNLLHAEIRSPGKEKSSMRDQSCLPLPEVLIISTFLQIISLQILN